jgi:hypothetical protein
MTTDTIIDIQRRYLVDHLARAHGVERSEALREATLAALDRRHVREHHPGGNEDSVYWRELLPPRH